jgi:serine/threonine protein kinase
MTPVEEVGREASASLAAGATNGPSDRLIAPEQPTADTERASTDAEAAFLDRVFVEYCKRLDAGEKPDIEEWCLRYPAYRDKLRRLFYTDVFVGNQLEELRPQPIPAKPMAWPVEGERRGDFTIRRELGRGSFSRVYLATEASTGDRLVAVKYTVRGDSEARTLGRLTHPHVVPILSARRDAAANLKVICMPYLGSATLDDVRRSVWLELSAAPKKASRILDVLRACAQPEDDPNPVHPTRLRNGSYAEGIIHLAVQLAQTLAFLHRRDILHRDLKPSNVLLDPTGKPLLLDFDLSVRARQPAFIAGTLLYMAPEQLHSFPDRFASEVEERVDVFALGVIIYELLAGEHPCCPLPPGLKEGPLAQYLLERLRSGFRPFRSLGQGLERPVAAMLDRCLAFDPCRRPSADELAAALQKQFTPVRRLRRRILARPRLSLSLLVVLLVACTIGVHVWSIIPPYSERQYRLGLEAYHQHEFEEAERHFDRAVRADPNHRQYRFARGCSRLQQSKLRPNDRDQLNQLLEDLGEEEQGATPAPTLAVLAYAHLRKHELLEAILLLTKIRNADYRPVMVLNNRAYAYMLLRRLDEAKEDLDLAASGQSPAQAVFYNRAKLALLVNLQDAKRPISPQAFRDIQLAIEIGPVTAALYYDAAFLYSQAAWNEFQQAPICLEAPMATALSLRARQAKVQQAMNYLHKAIAAGQRVELDKQSSVFYRVLNSHPGYSALQNLKPQQPLPARELRLLDPVELPDA